MNSTFLAVSLSAVAVHSEAFSPTSGLDWELWSIFLLWNIAECLVQAAVRGWTINVDVPLKHTFVIPHVVTMNLPVLSPRVDIVKDVVFAVTCVARGATRLAILSAVVIVVNSERAWAVHRLRAEVREEALPLLKPSTDDIDKQTTGDDKAGLRMRMFKQVLQIAQGMSTPLKIESAMWEDLPQTVLQIIFIANYSGAFFTKVTAAIGIIKIAAVVLMPPVILERTEPSIFYAERHIMGSAFAQNRRRAAESIGRWLDAASSQHNKNIAVVCGAVRAMHHALVEDTESDEVKATCAFTLITKAKFICSIDPQFGDSVNQAFDFISDNTSKGRDAKTATAVLNEALRLLTDKEMITNHEGVCFPLLKLIGQNYPLLEQRLRLNAVVVMSKACSYGSAILKAEFKRFVASSPLQDADRDCRLVAEAVRALSSGNGQALINLANSGSSEMRELSIIVAAQMLNDKEGFVRFAAAVAIFDIKGTENSNDEREAALATLTQALNDSEWRVRQTGVKALGMIGSGADLPHEVILAIAQALTDSELGVKLAGAKALRTIRIGAEHLHEVTLIIAQALDDPSGTAKVVVAEALGVIGSRAELSHEVIRAVAQVMKNDDLCAEGRRVVAEALGKIGSRAELPPEVVRAAVQALNGKGILARVAVARAILESMGTDTSKEGALATLKEALNDKRGLARVAAASALFEIMGTDNLNEEREAALATLKEALNNASWAARKAAAQSLERIGSDAELPHDVILAIAQTLNDKDDSVGLAAVMALGTIGSRAELPHEVIRAVAQVATTCEQDPSSKTKAICTMAATQQYSPDFALMLKEAFGDSSMVDIARIGYFAAMNKLSDLRADTQELIDKCVRDLRNDDWKMRVVAALALGHIVKGVGMTAVPWESLVQALKRDEDGDVRKACATSLQWCGKFDRTRAALGEAERTDEAPQVRAAAKASLKTIASSADPEFSRLVPRTA